MLGGVNLELLSVLEAAKLLRVDPQTIYRAIKRGEIRARRVGGQWRLTLDDLHMGRGRPPEREEADGGLVTEEGE